MSARASAKSEESNEGTLFEQQRQRRHDDAFDEQATNEKRTFRVVAQRKPSTQPPKNLSQAAESPVSTAKQLQIKTSAQEFMEHVQKPALQTTTNLMAPGQRNLVASKGKVVMNS